MTPPDGALALATQLLRQVEGCELSPYLDSGGVPTIGIGCTRIDGMSVTMRTPRITQAKAEAMLQFELGATERLLNAVVRAPLTAGEWAALASFVYNVGPGVAGKKDGFVTLKSGGQSTLLRLVNAGQMDLAALEFAKWNRVNGIPCPGLNRRRTMERTVFQTGCMDHATIAVASAAVAPPMRAIAVPARYSPADDLNAAELARVQGASA